MSADYGAVEQTGLYLDPLGAADWVEVSKQKSYQEARNSFPFAEAGTTLANYFLKQTRTDQLDVFALGCGEAKEEVCLTAHLARLMPSIRFFLIDTSQQLLIEGYRHAKQVLSVYSNVEVRAVLGDLFNVSQWMSVVSPSRARARRLVMLLGGTSLTIQNEVLFARIYHAHVEPNDLLMFDFFKTVAPITSPQEIAAKEPRLSEKSSMGWDHMIHKWHRALVRRYCSGVREVRFSYELDVRNSVIPGGYSVNMIAHATDENQKTRKVLTFHFKRHPPDQMVQSLRREGWDPWTSWSSGEKSQGVMYVFRKRS